ncbi:hypothetical protein [Vagococcus carniphilus]|uniref:hypothetical protein n=1 Tax=Vagococcus carniphilus TaxID=218144 RepID=UPI003BA84D6A
MENLSNSVGMVLLFLWLLRLIIKTKPIKESFRGVVIVLVIGGYLLVDGWSVLMSHHNSLVVVLVSLILGFTFGALRGLTMVLWYDNEMEQWMRKGTWISIAVFLTGMAVTHVVINWLSNDSRVVLSISQTLHMGVSMLGSRSIWRYRLGHMRASQYKKSGAK